MDMRTLCRSSLLLAVLAVTPAVLADPPGRDEAPEGMHMQRSLEKLDLTEEQRPQVKAVMDDTREAMRGLMERRRQALQAMEPGKQKADWDAAKARQRADEYGAVAADMAYQRMEVAHRLRQILTDSQWQQLQQMREERRDEFEDHMKERMKERAPAAGEGRRFERRAD